MSTADLIADTLDAAQAITWSLAAWIAAGAACTVLALYAVIALVWGVLHAVRTLTHKEQP